MTITNISTVSLLLLLPSFTIFITSTDYHYSYQSHQHYPITNNITNFTSKIFVTF